MAIQINGTPFCVIKSCKGKKEDGEIVYIGLHVNEDACWQIYLGWPSMEEIDEAQASGISIHELSTLRIKP